MAMAIDIIGHRYRLDTDIDNTHIFSYGYGYAHVDIHTRTYTLGYLPGTHSRPRHSIRGCLGNIPGNSPHPRRWPGLAARCHCSLVVCQPPHCLAAPKHVGFTWTAQKPSYPCFSNQARIQLEAPGRYFWANCQRSQLQLQPVRFRFIVPQVRRRCAGCWAGRRRSSGLPMSGVPAAGSPLFLRKNHRNKLFISIAALRTWITSKSS